MDGAGPSEELQEVEETLRKSKGDGKELVEDGTLDADEEKGHPSSSSASKMCAGMSPYTLGAENFKVFTQAFTLTFLAEWGKLNYAFCYLLMMHECLYHLMIHTRHYLLLFVDAWI